MSDQASANRLEQEGLQLFEAGQYEAAAQKYQHALALADPGYWRLADYHGAYACVLGALDRQAEARTQLELALAAELAQGAAQNSQGVLIARYFLADHMVRCGEPQLALQALETALQHAPDHWLVRMVQAEALAALGRVEEARLAAEACFANVASEEKRAELRARLQAILEAAPA
ncbi:tetratricopeptide repeat protein [Rugamonas rubra]|uniref:Tetratricopeptide repeat-containing protein n=1 Tax=Rugamonas rubra TaxID=758825 RepID=A0A1I4L2Q3_9BURK|nr:tetratricopeptide repeat protein [Rugamonas rubra]SFL85318.1 Tetratricopeptide repeat-containing protein [Rugamonas rubra]